MIKAEIFRSEMGVGYVVRIWREGGAAIYEVLHFGEDGEGYFTPCERGQLIKPTIRLHPEELKVLGDAISELGIKTDSDMKREGLLEATKFHLEDMRRLVFKEDKP